jgi:hypothetical protein
VISALLAVVIAASPAEPNEHAAALFREGEAAFARGEARPAAEAFEQAYRLAPHAAALYNAALAWQRASEPARAADLLELALSLHQLAPVQERDCENRLAALNPLLGTLRVLGEPGTLLSVAHVSRQAVPARVHLLPGHHVLTVELPTGEERRIEVDVLAGRVLEQDLGAAAPAAPPAPPEAVAVAAEPPPPPQAGLGGRRVAALGLGAGAVIAGAAAAVLGVNALSTAASFRDGGDVDAVLRDRAVTLRTATNVTWGVAAALAIVAIVLWISG